ncbi:MAG: aromatic ring-hydroxylating dioxygenase subunit alpha [Alphaproteobacteria bacterium]|nr:aromatic ring-hydroxylating dioxygenase subunit alpha [Alphaproteobacteria bacterium]MBU1512571.1 aromatic ring-hydroxylating dioxygenase subunit alpha [Alphaproteobacteria bacterium]MBU2092910.1 aromatic ring-hydroxylating dioxygenase subunit alpha [Alphaproteobacteria bacterium]MBU2150851.1 aromatic ring-hydroxylating dioxygenase subunit alpha [Alphaproteobacteria bacterium]MBU2307938.1 aromatic ring-hydroxylating dioxygenase subunit alpha [Alphaproteobacteria bacterium]
MADGEPRTARADARFGQGFLTDTWYFASLSGDLKPGKLNHIELLGEPVALGRGRGGQLFALRDVCPHRAAPLSAGRFHQDALGVETVACPYHGWRFRADGACAAIPSLTADQAMDVARIQVRRYPVAESQGMIFVWVGATPLGEPDQPPPQFPGVVGGGPKLVDRMVFDAHIDQAVVGLMDPAHGPYVHRQWWWRTAGSEHDKEKRFEPREAGFAMVRHAPSSNSRAYAILGGRPETEITFRLPGLRWEHVTVGKRQVLSLTCLTPLDAKRTQVTQLAWSDHPAFSLLKPVIARMARTFLRQDGDMVKLQNQGLKHDPTLLWIDDADRQAKWYQALKREWIASRREGRDFVNPVEPATLRWRS